MYNIDIYHNSEELLKHQEETIYIKFILIFLSIVIILCGLCFIKYPKIYYFEGFITNDKVILYLEKDSLNNLKGSKARINDKEISYIVEDIKYLDDNYYQVSILLSESIDKVNTISFTINDGKTNLYKEFIKKIWKGFN